VDRGELHAKTGNEERRARAIRFSRIDRHVTPSFSIPEPALELPKAIGNKQHIHIFQL
jgi:hypothetical protein